MISKLDSSKKLEFVQSKTATAGNPGGRINSLCDSPVFFKQNTPRFDFTVLNEL